VPVRRLNRQLEPIVHPTQRREPDHAEQPHPYVVVLEVASSRTLKKMTARSEGRHGRVVPLVDVFDVQLGVVELRQVTDAPRLSCRMNKAEQPDEEEAQQNGTGDRGKGGPYRAYGPAGYALQPCQTSGKARFYPFHIDPAVVSPGGDRWPEVVLLHPRDAAEVARLLSFAAALAVPSWPENRPNP